MRQMRQNHLEMKPNAEKDTVYQYKNLLLPKSPRFVNEKNFKRA